MGTVIALGLGAIFGWLGTVAMKSDAQTGTLVHVLTAFLTGVIGDQIAMMLGTSSGRPADLAISVAGATVSIAFLKFTGRLG